ncbi:endoplasmic reticulum metallopeptidase 1-like isoform X2 [Zootermopsis nevadensis]|uniref:FXNA-like protease n=1 Tax=Zootermopsis nevadensis TaxID=136037 RepID=A0A067R1N3_ZOONE|nr:endoplasmic reticulum metallopeptidase 1-like isoform X2 [Zootermopsis nevadensis]KDR16698.1 Endoplasmic reticulum metallopeptidase 1 [Zootermopsis nevadensis]
MEHGNIRLRLRNDENEDPPETYQPEQSRYSKPICNVIKLPTYAALVVFIIGVLLYGLAYALHYRLPTPLSLKDIGSHPDQFIAERSLNHLRQIAGYGSKPVGSYENEILAVEFLTREISFIMQRASPDQRISFDIQKCTGSYPLAYKPYGFTNYYSQVQNLLVKLSSNANSSSSLLINCHFDSVPTSPGGSDDGLNCAVMLEVLEILSRSKTPLKHNVIFLFNGAEESPLQASHGFITQHKWAHEVKAFINLEACGAGGRETLFQAGPNHPWLIQMYADSVPHPHGHVLGEDIFQSGLVPSDTDYRIFRDFGKIPGLDFAHAMNGYVYHTRYDNLHAIPTGTLQHTGDNLLALTKRIASSDILSNPQEYAAGRTVYFDVLGLFMVSYSETAGIILNVFIVVLSVYTVTKNIHTIKSGPGLNHTGYLKLFLLSCVIPAVGWLLAFVNVLLVALILDLFSSSMSWFTRPGLVFSLYYCPVLVCCMVFPLLLQKYINKQSPFVLGVQCRLYVNGVQCLWTILLLAGTISGIRSTFVFMILVLFPTLSSLMLNLSRWRNNLYMWLTVYISSTLPSVIFFLYHTVMGFGFFIPITGRIGPVKNPDFIIGILSALLCILSTSYVTPLIILVRRPWQVMAGAFGLHLLTILLVILTPLGFPYSANPSAPTPQRIYVFHTERMFHDLLGHVRFQDSGYWLVNLDRHSPHSVWSLIPEVAEAQPVGSTCEEQLMGGFPVFSPRVIEICEFTHWIPASPPVFHRPTNLELASEQNVSQTTTRLTFHIQGPDHMSVLLAPSVKLINWSFDAVITESGYKWENKSVYFINYAQGLTGIPFEFWIDLEVTKGPPSLRLDIAVIGQYINSHEYISEGFKTFLRKYPDWAHVTAWAATYKAWKF